MTRAPLAPIRIVNMPDQFMRVFQQNEGVVFDPQQSSSKQVALLAVKSQLINDLNKHFKYAFVIKGVVNL